MKVTVIDYGLSNLLSVQHAFVHFGAEVQVTSSPADVLAADALVLPGVGAFQDGMQGLEQLGLIEPIKQKTAQGTLLLGICLGMQMLFDESEEFGLHKGLGLIPGRVVRIPDVDADGSPQRVPHISWDPLYPGGGRTDFSGTALAALKPGEVMMIENVRFHKEEEKNDPAFAKELADLADVYVCDAFGSAHRAHASVAGVTKFITAKGGENVVGYLMQKEIDFLGKAVENPVRPFVAILGGAKVADKLNVISNLLEKCDTLIIGGGMAYTFFLAQGLSVGQSLKEEDWVERAGEMLKKAEEKGVKILLPIDNRVADHFGEDAVPEVVASDAIPDDREGMDIGPKTEELYAEAVKGAKTVFWNGPMGVFEFDNFAHGTEAVCRAVADSDCTSIIGGGDSVAAVNKFGLADKMSWISTGGGASMELVEGKALPGVEALLDA